MNVHVVILLPPMYHVLMIDMIDLHGSDGSENEFIESC